MFYHGYRKDFDGFEMKKYYVFRLNGSVLVDNS